MLQKALLALFGMKTLFHQIGGEFRAGKGCGVASEIQTTPFKTNLNDEVGILLPKLKWKCGQQLQGDENKGEINRACFPFISLEIYHEVNRQVHTRQLNLVPTQLNSIHLGRMSIQGQFHDSTGIWSP